MCSSDLTPAKVVLELSVADSAQLVGLKGIGPVLAGRIVRYRSALGGFTSVEQLKEVYGISDTLFAVIAPQLVLDSLCTLRKLDLNTDSLSVLVAHPYIRYKLGNAFIRYRKQHERINSVNALNEMGFVPREIIPKIAPYLKF